MTHIVGPFYGHLPGLPFGMANIANLGNTGTWPTGPTGPVSKQTCKCSSQAESVIVGLAAERFAENDRAYDDELAAKLYEKSGYILSQKIGAFDSGRTWA